MIIDVPTGDDLKSAGIDFLNLAWDTLISLSTKLKDAEYFYNVYYSDENEEVIDQLSSEQYWKQAQRPLSTALSLIQQGTEFRFFGLSYAMDGVIRDETLIETDITAIFVNCLRSGAN
jgi:hypothetical protein